MVAQDNSMSGNNFRAKRKSVRLSSKLGGTFGIVLLMAAGMGYVGYNGLTTVRLDVDRIAQDNQLYGTSQHIKTLMLQHRRYEKDIFLNIGSREKQVDKYIPKLEAKSEEIQDAIRRMADAVQADRRFEADIKEKTAQLPDLYAQYYQGMRTVAARAIDEAEFTPQAANKAMKPYKVAIHDLESNIDEIAAAVTDVFGHGVGQTQTAAGRATTLLGFVGLGVIGLGSLLAVLLTRGIVRPISHAIAELNEGAHQVDGAAGQVSTASQQLAAGSSEQASSLQDTASALEEMAVMTNKTAENAQEAAT